MVVTLEEEMTTKLNVLREKHAAISAVVAEISKPHSTEEIEVIKKQLKVQEEELVQLMIKVDAIETVGSEELRNLRRSTVKGVQATLDVIDAFLKAN